MTARRWLWWTGSLALTTVLIIVLVRVSKLDFGVTVRQLRSVRWFSFAQLCLLTALHVYLSSQKWRRVDARLRRSYDSAPSWTMSFALTGTGVALGQILPVQVSMSAARTLGTYFHGTSVKRGTGGTLFEQAFDLLIVIFVAVASGMTLIYRGRGMMWSLWAIGMTAFAILAVGPSVRLIHRLIVSFNARTSAPHNRILRSFKSLEHSGLLNAELARQLMALSAARFAVQVLMAAQTSQAVGASIPLWHLAAAMPFVVIAGVIVVTPGSLGINELSYATTLHLFGTPLNVGAQWALANRILVASSCVVVAGCSMGFLCLSRILAAKRNKVIQEEQPR
jgi:uncharacterized membrane protein YbhN (UPF0104 family)